MRLASYAREVLTASQFGGIDGRINVRAAVYHAVSELADATILANAEANRRMLLRLITEQPPRRLREKSLRTVALVLDAIRPGSAVVCDGIANDQARVKAWHRAMGDARAVYFAAPDVIEHRALLLPGVKADRELAEKHVVERMAARLLPLDPLPTWALRQIERFRERAIARGHVKRRVDISVKRALTPMTWHGRTAGLERGWHELELREQKAVLHHSLELERIWLGLNPASQRIRRSGPPSGAAEGDSLTGDVELDDLIAAGLQDVNWDDERAIYKQSLRRGRNAMRRSRSGRTGA